MNTGHTIAAFEQTLLALKIYNTCYVHYTQPTITRNRYIYLYVHTSKRSYRNYLSFLLSFVS